MTAEKILQLFSAEFGKKAEQYRAETFDPHGINTAVYVAMMECKNAADDALKKLIESEVNPSA